MPKILINEKDRTSPGSASSYANFSVLLAGFARTTPTTEEQKLGITADKIEELKNEKQDSNGVFEFTSAEDFKNVIGLVSPKAELGSAGSEVTVYHYGNQMAYELLNMGYTVLYKVVAASELDKLGTESFWEDFKDKSNYDFRFVSHGLLESTKLTETVATEYDSKLNRLADLEKAVAILLDIETKYPMPAVVDGVQPDGEAITEVTGNRNEAYASEANGCAGFKPLTNKGAVGTTPYESFAAAYEGVIGVKDDASKPGEINTLKTAISNLLAGSVTTELINDANACIANLAEYTASGAKDANGDATNDMYMKAIPGRGDCVALIEVDENKYATSTSSSAHPEVRIIDAINEMTGIDAGNGKFCAMTVPSVYYKMAIDKDNPNEFDNNVKFPGAFHYLACFMNSLNLGFAEWYAAAGYTRGVASYMVDFTSVKLGEIAINALEPRNWDDPQKDYPKFACNVIANFRGSYYLWGNRTAHPLGKKNSIATGDLVASSFLNIRQLCCSIKKQLYVACRSFTFDPNSDTLWVNFCNAIRPTLEAMKADQGVRDYKIVKVYTDKKATLKAKIRIIPIEAVEDFDLEVSLEDSFGETAAVVTE